MSISDSILPNKQCNIFKTCNTLINCSFLLAFPIIQYCILYCRVQTCKTFQENYLSFSVFDVRHITQHFLLVKRLKDFCSTLDFKHLFVRSYLQTCIQA